MSVVEVDLEASVPALVTLFKIELTVVDCSVLASDL